MIHLIQYFQNVIINCDSSNKHFIFLGGGVRTL